MTAPLRYGVFLLACLLAISLAGTASAFCLFGMCFFEQGQGLVSVQNTSAPVPCYNNTLLHGQLYTQGAFCQDDCAQNLGPNYSCTSKCFCCPDKLKEACLSAKNTWHPDTCTCTAIDKPVRLVSCAYNTQQEGRQWGDGSNAFCADDCNKTFGSNYTCTSNCVCVPTAPATVPSSFSFSSIAILVGEPVPGAPIAVLADGPAPSNNSTFCVNSTYPACGGWCGGVKKQCASFNEKQRLGSEANASKCGCDCLAAKTATLGFGESVSSGDFTLSIISFTSWNGVSFSLFGSDNTSIANTTLAYPVPYRQYDPATGRSIALRFDRMDNGSVSVRIYPECPAGQYYDFSSCKCKPSAERLCSAGSPGQIRANVTLPACFDNCPAGSACVSNASECYCWPPYKPRYPSASATTTPSGSSYSPGTSPSTLPSSTTGAVTPGTSTTPGTTTPGTKPGTTTGTTTDTTTGTTPDTTTPGTTTNTTAGTTPGTTTDTTTPPTKPSTPATTPSTPTAPSSSGSTPTTTTPPASDTAAPSAPASTTPTNSSSSAGVTPP